MTFQSAASTEWWTDATVWCIVIFNGYTLCTVMFQSSSWCKKSQLYTYTVPVDVSTKESVNNHNNNNINHHHHHPSNPRIPSVVVEQSSQRNDKKEMERQWSLLRISGTVGEVREEGWNSSHLHSSLSLSPLDFLLAPPSSVFTPHPLPLCSSPLTQWAPGGVDSRSTLHQPGSQTGQPPPPPHLTALLRNTLTCCLTPPAPPPSPL